MIGTEALVTAFTFDKGINHTFDVAAGDPDFGMHQDSGFDADHVIAFLDHSAPPGLFDIAFQFYAERPVIPATGYAAVDFTIGENEAAAAG